MKSLSFILASLILSNCSSEQFQDIMTKNSENRQIPSESLEGASGGINSQASHEDAVVGDNGNADAAISESALDTTNSMEDKLASEPVMVAGAFLVCQQFEDFYCRLDTSDQQNIEIHASFTISIRLDGVMVTPMPSDRPDWRWRFISNTANVMVVELTLISTSRKEYKYVTEIQGRPLQIGDGTQLSQGCLPGIRRAAELVGITFSRSITVNQPSKFAINLIGVCGIVRANDSYLSITDSNNAEVFQVFLPTTRNPLNLHYQTNRLPSGTYNLTIAAGDDIDIDDLFVSGFGWSPIPSVAP